MRKQIARRLRHVANWLDPRSVRVFLDRAELTYIKGMEDAG